MSIEWPLDDIRNGRWEEFSSYLDQLINIVNEVELANLLLVTVFYNQLEVARTLVAAGSNVNFRYDGDECSKFAYDLEPGTTAIGQTILGAAWEMQETLEMLKLLIVNNADINGYTFSGYTPLQLAIVMQQPSHAKLLLDSGADPWKPSADLDKPNAFDFADSYQWAKNLLYSAK